MSREGSSSMWIGYGMILDPSFWTKSFEMWWLYYQGTAHFLGDKQVIVIPLATTAKEQARWLGVVEWSDGMVFALDEIAQVIPQELIDRVRQEWEEYRQDAARDGYMLPAGRLLFAHTMD